MNYLIYILIYEGNQNLAFSCPLRIHALYSLVNIPITAAVHCYFSFHHMNYELIVLY